MRVTRRPLRSAVIVVALTLASALSASLFAVVDGLKHPRPPFSSGERVALVSFRQTGGQAPGVQYLPELADRRSELVRILSDATLVEVATQMGAAGAFGNDDAQFAGVEATGVDPTFFDLLALAPVAGTPLLPSDERWSTENAEAAPLPVVIGWQLAQRLFGDAQKPLGTHELAGRSVFVRGVMPNGVKFPGETNVWTPLSHSRARVPGLIRLRPNVRLETIAGQAPELDLRPVTAPTDRSQARLPYLLFVASVLLMLVALIQSAALLSSEMLERTSELRIRLALGGSWTQVAAPLVSRVARLCAASAALALLATPLLTRALSNSLPTDIVRGQYLEPGVHVLQLGFALACAAFAILAAVPLMALRAATRQTDTAWIREASAVLPYRGGFASLTIQVALTAALVYIASVAWIGLMNFWRFDYGFATSEVLSFRMPAPQLSNNSRTVFAEIKQVQVRLGQSMIDVGKISGVVAVAGAYSAPLGAGMSPDPEGLTFQGRSRDGLLARSNVVSSGFVRALGARIVAGRDPDESELRGQKGLVIINTALARRLLLPGASELESQLLVGQTISSRWTTGRIVAVIDDLVQRSPEGSAEPEFYTIQPPPNAFSRVLIRTRADSLPAIRSVLEREWGPLRPFHLRWMTEELAPFAAPYTSQARLMTLVVVGAIPLVALGFFGAISLFVRAREREIAIRIAIGARVSDVRWLVLQRSVLASGIGWAVGVGLGALLCRLASIRLFGVATLDLASVALSILLIAGLTALASSLPLRRAVRIDPAVLLRQSHRV